jgi:hypothetical protein
MFSKRVKCIRDMNDEVEVLEKRLDREIKKLNDNVLFEIKKKLRSVSPNIQVKVKKIRLDDFLDNRKRQTPLSIYIESLNGKKVHNNGFWVENDQNWHTWRQTDNRIPIERMEEICRELSEQLEVNIQLYKVAGESQFDDILEEITQEMA